MEQLLKRLNLQLPAEKEKVRLNVNVADELVRLMRLCALNMSTGQKIPSDVEKLLETFRAKVFMMYMNLLNGVTTIPRLETLEKARVTEKTGPRLSRINQDLASRAGFKILNTQVLSRTTYAPLTKVAVHYNSNEMNSKYKSLEELRSFLHVVLPVVTHLDTAAKPELIDDWMKNVALDSPTAHRNWLAIDDKLGNKTERAKLNNLLRMLFDAEEHLAVLVYRFSDTEADHKKVLGLIDVSFFASTQLPRAKVKQMLDKLQVQFRFLHGAHCVSYITKSDINDQVFQMGDDDSDIEPF